MLLCFGKYIISLGK
uniref:Uncharacterized protein n=1 Tax=Rhizophora mucronata TaxID=61149 RepID=A0A2P2MWP5_RHIMU